jgi:xylulokinase
MHGLVVVDKDQNVLRPSIIWCDSRAAVIGDSAFNALGGERCLSSLLNSPGNFTASKLKWVKENEPELYAKIDKIMLPGDFIAMNLPAKYALPYRACRKGCSGIFKPNRYRKW